MYDYVLRRFCVKHLERNLLAERAPGEDFKNLLWKLADAPTQADNNPRTAREIVNVVAGGVRQQLVEQTPLRIICGACCAAHLILVVP